jgi:hypothetical protein
MASLSYGTSATSLNIKECEERQRSVVNTTLPKMGIKRHTSRSVVISGLWSPTKGRLRDVALMDEFTMQGIYDKQMRDVNRCRIYLQAFCILDITDLAGKSIEDWARQGKRQAHRTIKWNWPVQQRPQAAA